jgi:hypothetical protein
MHYYLIFRYSAKDLAIHDHHWLFPGCSCLYFKEMETKGLGKHGHLVSCKHLYFIFINICSLDFEVDTFVHAPSFSFNKVKQIFGSKILIHRLP